MFMPPHILNPLLFPSTFSSSLCLRRSVCCLYLPMLPLYKRSFFSRKSLRDTERFLFFCSGTFDKLFLAHLYWGRGMHPVSACLLRAPVPWCLDQTGTFPCRSLANEETETVWPETKRGRKMGKIHELVCVLLMKSAHIATHPPWWQGAAVNSGLYTVQRRPAECDANSDRVAARTG